MTATDVSWMLELSLKPGHEAEFTALMTEMVAATSANEAGALSYEWSLSADGATCVVYGSPSPQVKEGLAVLNPVYMRLVGGFNR
jgi:hypothetical protein